MVFWLNHALVFEEVADTHDLNSSNAEDEQTFNKSPEGDSPSILICDCGGKMAWSMLGILVQIHCFQSYAEGCTTYFFYENAHAL